LWSPDDVAEILWSLIVTHVTSVLQAGGQNAKTREFCLGFLTAMLVVAYALQAAQVVERGGSQLRLSDRIRGLVERTKSGYETE
jgi:hypothetical protein